MMSIRFRCQCGQKLRVGDEKAGQRAQCPRCKAAVTVPATSDPSLDVAPSGPPMENAREASSMPVLDPSTVKAETPSAAVSSPISNADIPAFFDQVATADAGTPPPVSIAPVIRVDDRPASNLPEISIRDDSSDWIYEPSTDRKGAGDSVIDYDKIAVPRRVLYAQGILLGVVAAVSFVLGLFVGRTSELSSDTASSQPCTLQGHVVYGDDPSRPDVGSVVIVLPTERKPMAESRVAVEGLRPGDPLPADDNLSLRTLRSLGGDYARTNEQGEYQIRLPEGGKYHVLVVSHRAARSSGDRLNMTEIALMGSYFTGPTELVGDRKFQLRTVTMHLQANIDAAF